MTSSRTLGSRRTRQEGVTVAKKEARGLYQLPPFAFVGALEALTQSAPWDVTHDVEIFRVKFSASDAGTSGSSVIQMKKNGLLVMSFTISAATVRTSAEVDALGVDRFFFKGPEDYLSFACTTSAGHKNFTCQPIAYDNEGR